MFIRRSDNEGSVALMRRSTVLHASKAPGKRLESEAREIAELYALLLHLCVAPSALAKT